jgi:hypothetical protein
VTLSKRKLESYRRAEIVAQMSRKLASSGANWRDPMLANEWAAMIRDWMMVTGKLKYDMPKRRGRNR